MAEPRRCWRCGRLRRLLNPVVEGLWACSWCLPHPPFSAVSDRVCHRCGQRRRGVYETVGGELACRACLSEILDRAAVGPARAEGAGGTSERDHGARNG
jgi:hypothetical protein